MGLLDVFKSKKNHTTNKITSYQDFWGWFQKHQLTFHSVVKSKDNIEKSFFDELGPKLDELRPGFYFLTGMSDPETVELIITVDGVLKNIVFAEEIIAAAPKISGWKFTALKPESDTNISMGKYNYNNKNLWFYSNTESNYPDEIDITVAYDDYNNIDSKTIDNGIYIFLDNFLGELKFSTIIDNLNIISSEKAVCELVPIEKLKPFLIWREKEFIEKYEGIRQNTDNDSYALLKATLNNGDPLIAVINTDLLNWDAKASHPWILNVEIKFNANNNNGMPDNKISDILNEIEDQLTAELKDFEGFLNIGRETASGIRNIYFACRNFRKAVKIAESVKLNNCSRIELDYNIFKDKYWKSFNRFIIA